MKIQKINEWLATEKNEDFVDNIIVQLNDLDIDGETMEYIITGVNMQDQMLHQLIEGDPKAALTYLIDASENFDFKELDDFVLNKIKDDPDFHKRILDVLLKIDANKYNL